MCFEPWRGWGWYRHGVSEEERFLDYALIDAAGVFHIRVRRFFDGEGQPRGFIGRVEQVGHLFDGLWGATWTMRGGEFDLVERLCERWDMALGPTDPRFEAEWPVPPDTPPAFASHGGVLALSHAAISAFRERQC